MPIYPITFSIPDSKILKEIPNKTKILSDLIPGNMNTYIYNNEEEYYNEYKSSVFATTTKKAGWDCMRHYEIIACGAIPYFPNIENCPENTMKLLSKDLIKYGNVLYEKYAKVSINEVNMTECTDLISKLLEYTRESLTTSKLAEYILRVTGHNDIKRILYLSSCINPDYLRCLTLHGFKELLGKDVHDYPMIPHIYKSTSIDYNKLYGKGITYTNLLSENLHDTSLDTRVYDDIINKKYDIVIYGSYHRGMPFYDIVTQNYPADKVILLCGEDEHNCDYAKYVEIGHHVFVRELK